MRGRISRKIILNKMSKRKAEDGSDDEEDVQFGRRAGTAMVGTNSHLQWLHNSDIAFSQDGPQLSST